VREPSEWSGGSSDIEGKTTRVGASECGQRTSFNRTREAGHLDEILALNNNTAGVREREDAHRTREAGHLDEIQALNNNTAGVREREDAHRTREAGAPG
jgi:ribosomal protein S7